MASWPPAPSTIAMVTTTGHGRSSPHRTPWLRSLTAADTCADVRVFVGRRLLPAGPPAEERMEGREGRERPGLPRIWVGTGPASRVAHAPCQCPDRPDKRGPDRVQIRTRLRAQIQITIAPAVVLAIKLARCRTVGSRTDGRSPVHTEAARPAETGRRLAARRVHHAARRLVRQHPPDRPTSAPAIHQRTVSTSGRHFRSPNRSAWARCFRTPCARGWPSSASPPRTSLMSGCGCRSWRSAGPGTAACLAP